MCHRDGVTSKEYGDSSVEIWKTDGWKRNPSLLNQTNFFGSGGNPPIRPSIHVIFEEVYLCSIIS